MKKTFFTHPTRKISITNYHFSKLTSPFFLFAQLQNITDSWTDDFKLKWIFWNALSRKRQGEFDESYLEAKSLFCVIKIASVTRFLDSTVQCAEVFKRFFLTVRSLTFFLPWLFLSDKCTMVTSQKIRIRHHQKVSVEKYEC